MGYAVGSSFVDGAHLRHDIFCGQANTTTDDFRTDFLRSDC
jgi:hypothetical protein